MTVTSASVLLNRLQARARLRHLQVLVRVAELRNLRRSAEALGLSQPAVTQLLADLERLLELPLFERHARGVRITPAGAQLLPLARRMLDALAEGSEALTALKQAGEGVVRVAAITSAVSGLLVQAVPAFARAHPRIQLQVRECDVDQWPLLLARGEADLAACRGSTVPPAGHVFRPLVEDHFVVACGTAHPLAGRQGVRWSTLARETWLPAPVGMAARRVFDQVMAELGVAPRQCPVATRVLALTWSLLQSERLVTLLPWGVVRQLVESGRLAVIRPMPALPLAAADAQALAPIGLMLPQQGLTVAGETFVGFLEHFVHSQSPAGRAPNDGLPA